MIDRQRISIPSVGKKPARLSYVQRDYSTCNQEAFIIIRNATLDGLYDDI